MERRRCEGKDKGTISDKGGEGNKKYLVVPPILSAKKIYLAHKHTCNSVAFFSLTSLLQCALSFFIHKLILVPNLSIPLLTSSFPYSSGRS